MHIAFIHPFTFRLVRGIESLIQQLANALVQLDVQVTLITEHRRPSRLQVVELDSRVQVLEVPTFRFYTSYTVIPWYVAFLCKYSFDRLITFFGGYGIGPAYNIALRWVNLPIYLYLGYSFTQAPHRYAEFRRYGLDQKAAGIMAVSAMTARETEACFGRSVTVLTPGVDGHRLRPNPEAGRRLRASLGIPADTLVLLSAAALEARKGIHHVIATMPRLLEIEPDLHCLIAGDGPERFRLEAQAEKLGVARQVHFLGPREDMPAVYNAADVFCSMSVSEASVTGMVTWEAMACGVPAVFVSNDPGEAERWRDVSILLKEPDSVTATNAIARLLGDSAERERLGQAGRRFITEKFDWRVIARQFLQIVDGGNSTFGALHCCENDKVF
jgi:glycosyltransferase involved in cell wall biosynthesis